MKTLRYLALLLLLSSAAWAQHTTVTAQVLDPTGVTYRNCTGSANFVGQNSIPGAGPYLLGGSVFQTVVPISCDSFGRFTISLADNNQISPTPSQWNFAICSALNAFPGPPICFNTLITITGTSQNITTQLQAASVTLPPYAVKLETNGIVNGTQGLLNLIQGTNVTITDNGLGGVTISSAGGGGGGGLPPFGTGTSVVTTNLVATNPGDCGIWGVGNVLTDAPCPGASGGIVGAPAVNTQVAGNGFNFIAQTKPIYDTRDWMTCDGNGTTGTDTTSGLNALLGAIGTTEATIRWIGTTTANATCRVGNFFTGPNITNDFSGGGAIQLISSSTVIGSGAYVSGTSVECGAGITCSLPAFSVTPGNTLVVMEAPYPGFVPNKTVRVTDTCGNFYIHAFQSLANQPRNQGAWIASNIIAPGGSCTITATANTSLTTHMMAVAQISGMGPVTSIDTSASNNSTGTTMSSGSATTLTGTLLLAFGGQPFTAETCTAGAGYTQPAGLAGQSASGFMCVEYNNASAGGSTSATQTITSSASWVYSLLSLKPGNATATIWGGIVDPDLHQIFYNADSQTGHGVVDFTGANVTQDVYPEWWGATGSDFTGATNTTAIQAAEYAAFGCGLTQCRTSSSALSIYNRPLKFSTVYNINDEIKFYHVNGFKIYGINRLSSGMNQTSVNKRILVGDAISYGVIQDMSFATQSAQDGTHPLVLLDYTGTIGADTKNQFIDLHRVNFIGNGAAAVGLQNSSSGAAQGSNINCWDCAFQSFSTAAEQIGTSTSLAQNALDNSVIQGDIQGCPNYGIAVYGGNVTVRDMTFENGFTSQTGFDVLCSATQFTCYIQSVRSESRRLASGSNLAITNSKTLNQGLFPTPGSGFPVNTIFTSQTPGGDGKYYKVTVDTSPLGGVGTPGSTILASGGSPTTVVNTNQTMSGSNTIKRFVLGETITQAVTGSTATVLTLPNGTATVSGTLTSGVFTGTETVTQSVTGITATEVFPTPKNSPPVPLSIVNLSGTADNTHTWVGGTSGAVFTPSAAPSFPATSMLVTAATGAPDNTHNWTGGTSSAVFVPTTVPVGPNYTVNAFAGFRATIMAGTNAACYGVITSNTATTITVTSWLTQFQFVPCSAPDSTSTFIVEPNWGTQFTSGGVTWVDLNENGIDGGGGTGLSSAILDNVDIPGDRLNLVGPDLVLKNVTVTRNDWANLTGGNQYSSWNIINNVLDVRNRTGGAISGGIGTVYQPWSLPKVSDAGTVIYSGPFQQNMGSKPFVWSVGSGGGAPKAADDVWIGGRSDPTSKADHTRAILEFGGMLGRAVPFGTDKVGTDTDIAGGGSTGAGAAGAINFWTSSPGGSSATPNSALKRWLISGVGNLLAGADGTYNIGTPSSNRPNNVYVAGAVAVAGPPGISTGTASNTDLTGELAFAGATTSATYTFAGTYVSHPECTFSPQFSPGAGHVIWISTLNLTTLQFSSDIAQTGAVSYVCHGRN